MSNSLELPTVLTDEVQKRILQLLSEGNFLKVACKAAGTTYRTFRWWQKRWEEDDPAARRFHEFFAAAEVASAVGECAALRVVRAGELGWQGSSWFLERRHPARWAKKQPPPNQTTINVETLTDEQLNDLTKGQGGGRA